jgi:metallophosphoesterase (TIGR03767 family)
MRGAARVWRSVAVAGTALLTAAVAAAGSYAHSGDERPRAHARAAQTAGESTLEQTLVGGDPRQAFQFLTEGPGEPHLVREELARAQAGRAERRRSLLYMAQLTDFQLSDEESPARVEFLDREPSGFASSAWRPQEALVAHQVEYTIRQVNRFLDSPVRQGDGSRARLANAVLTGDLADNQQRNETEWVVRLLEGGTVDPSSGTDKLEGTACEGLGEEDVPDLKDPDNYTGVQDYDDYSENPDFYDPDQPIAPLYGDWPVFEGLMDRAQHPFEAEGLRVPSYVAFGNHDALAQGNQKTIKPFEEVATGCIKPLAAPSPGLLDALNPTFLQSVITDPTKAFLVPPDEQRQYVDKLQFKDLHRTGRQADRHGFAFVDRDELEASGGAASYYSFAPKPGVRYIVIDTVCEGGVTGPCSSGNIDDPQFRWLERELAAAGRRNELVVTFGHHATGSLTADVPDETPPPCTANDEHGHDVNPGCDRDPRLSTPLHLGDDLEALFHRFPNVIAYVAGHSHENEVSPLRREGGGLWEIKSPAVVDYPPQHRLIEVMDNRDGTLSIFGTLLDHASPATSPGATTTRSHGGAHVDASNFDPAQLASTGRTLTYNDPQVGPGNVGGDTGENESSEAGPEGFRRDRNVELVIRDPRRAATADTGGGGASPATPPDDTDDTGRGRRGGRRLDAAGAGQAGALPFTGFPLVPLAVLGLLMLLGGAMACRRVRS